MAVHTVQYEGLAIAYELTRKNVKYINLRVTPKGQVVVSAGRNVPLSVIEDFVQEKALWIVRHLAEMEKRKQETSENMFSDGKQVYYLGKPYRLRLRRGETGVFWTDEEIWLILPEMDAALLRQTYLFWLKGQAVQKFEEIMNRIYPLVEEYAIAKPVIKIRNMKTIWGSCTPSGNSIRLNLQLMKADEDCIEQVVLHELLHFRYPNHGKAFYAQMYRLMPDWKERKQRLESQYRDGIF